MKILRHSAVAIVILVLGACSASPQEGYLPPDPQVIEVAMTEYDFNFRPDITAGRTVFRARNAGTMDHDLALFALSLEVAPIKQQLAGSVRLAIVPDALFGPTKPSETGTFAADLAPNQRYALLCTVFEDGQTHAVKGMAEEFKTPAAL